MEFSCSILLTRIVRQWCFGSKPSKIKVWRNMSERVLFLENIFYKSNIFICIVSTKHHPNVCQACAETRYLYSPRRKNKAQPSTTILRTILFYICVNIVFLLADIWCASQNAGYFLCLTTISNSNKQIYNHSLPNVWPIMGQPRIKRQRNDLFV